MAKKIEKSIPWLTILAIGMMVIFGAGTVLKEVIADTAQPSVTVGNVAPTVGAVTLDGGSNITVVENTTTSISGTTSITDDNGANDISTVTSSLYLNATGSCGSGDDADNESWCYYTSNSDDCSTTSCASAKECVWSCTFDVYYFAAPTTPTTSYGDNMWEMHVTAVDSGSNSDGATTSEELNTLYALDVSSSIPYGSVNPGATSTDQLQNATNTGNYAIDVYLSGDNMDDGGSNSIGVGQQKYSSSSLGDWTGTALSGTATGLDLDLAVSDATPTSDSADAIYWQIKIPDPQAAASYTGTNTADAGDAI